MTLAIFLSWADRFESYLVKNPEDRFYRNEAYFTFWYRTVWGNSVPDQTACSWSVFTVCHSVCIFWDTILYTCMYVKTTLFSNFRVISAILGVFKFFFNFCIWSWKFCLGCKLLVSHFWDLCKQCRPRSDAGECDQGLHCLLTGIFIKNKIKMKSTPDTPKFLEMDLSNW